MKCFTLGTVRRIRKGSFPGWEQTIMMGMVRELSLISLYVYMLKCISNGFPPVALSVLLWSVLTWQVWLGSGVPMSHPLGLSGQQQHHRMARDMVQAPQQSCSSADGNLDLKSLERKRHQIILKREAALAVGMQTRAGIMDLRLLVFHLSVCSACPGQGDLLQPGGSAAASWDNLWDFQWSVVPWANKPAAINVALCLKNKCCPAIAWKASVTEICAKLRAPEQHHSAGISWRWRCGKEPGAKLWGGNVMLRQKAIVSM